jgi:hypothetical protein
MKIFYLFCILVFIGCAGNKNKNDFEKRIPLDFAGNFDLTYAYTKAETDYLGLKRIDNGFDSMCIRLWFLSANSVDQKMVEFRKRSESKQWEGNYYYMVQDTANIKLKYPNGPNEIVPDTGRDYYFIDTGSVMYAIREKKELIPSQGWQNFGRQLTSANITKFRDWVYVDHYENGNFNTLIVEISTSKYYRVFSYPHLSKNFDDKSVKKVFSLMELVEKSFKLNLIDSSAEVMSHDFPNEDLNPVGNGSNQN